LTLSNERRTVGLREDRRCFAGMSDVYRAHLYPVEKLRTARKLGPGDRITERLQTLFEDALLLEKRIGTECLVAYADDFLLSEGMAAGCN
jgi:hypothetical protein